GPAASLPGGGAASEPPGFCSSAIANSLGRLLHLSPAGTGCQIAQVGQTIAFCRLSPGARPVHDHEVLALQRTARADGICQSLTNWCWQVHDSARTGRANLSESDKSAGLWKLG